MSEPRRSRRTSRRAKPGRTRTAGRPAALAAALALVLVGIGVLLLVSTSSDRSDSPDPEPAPPEPVGQRARSPGDPGRPLAPRDPETPPRPPESAPPAATGRARARVARVIDGDTIDVLVEGRSVRIRYLGVNAPESIPATEKGVEFFGREASRRNHELVEGREVELEFEGDRTDPYGRTLAYVWVGDRLVQRVLLEEGCAEVYRRASYISRFAEFDRLENVARSRGLGMWDPADRRRWRERH